jgi:hypothetical protein
MRARRYCSTCGACRQPMPTSTSIGGDEAAGGQCGLGGCGDAPLQLGVAVVTGVGAGG